MALLLPGAAPALAQSPLPNQFTSEDGSLTFSYPKGWWINEGSSSIDLASTEAALGAADPAVEMPPGAILIQFALPETLTQLGVDSLSTPEEAAQTVMAAVNATGEIEPYDGGPEGSVIASFEGGAWEDPTLIIVVPHPGRLLVVAVRLGGSQSSYFALVRDIVNSVEMEGESLSRIGEDGLLHQWAQDATGSSQYGEESWSFLQATGAPDTRECGDITTAWASATATGQDSLALNFGAAVIPTQINIYQTYNPGSIVFVEIGNLATGESLAVPDSADPPGNTDCPGIFTIDVADVPFAVDTVVIYLDQTIVGVWNEIDAVELVGVPAEELPEPVATAEATRDASQ
jgi:hypothetical protein